MKEIWKAIPNYEGLYEISNFGRNGERFPLYGKRGSRSPKSKSVKQILNGEVINTFAGTREAERATGIAHSNISEVCRGKMITAGGFRWQYNV